jgi:hypothetical protein
MLRKMLEESRRKCKRQGFRENPTAHMAILLNSRFSRDRQRQTVLGAGYLLGIVNWRDVVHASSSDRK